MVKSSHQDKHQTAKHSNAKAPWGSLALGVRIVIIIAIIILGLLVASFCYFAIQGGPVSISPMRSTSRIYAKNDLQNDAVRVQKMIQCVGER